MATFIHLQGIAAHGMIVDALVDADTYAADPHPAHYFANGDNIRVSKVAEFEVERISGNGELPDILSA